eukprot:15364692-Ditylum_brightwellii.AAC.1
MKNAEQHNHLDDTQYIGRQGRVSINPVVIKVLSLEVSHFQRSNIGMTDCDAKACYDWIFLAIAALLETKSGAPANISMLFARTLQDMRYYMVMAKGISKETNSHSNQSWGSGQEACDSPVKWGLISNTIIKCHNKWAIGRKIQDPTRRVQKKRDNAIMHSYDNEHYELQCYITGQVPMDFGRITRVQEDAVLRDDMGIHFIWQTIPTSRGKSSGKQSIYKRRRWIKHALEKI